MERIKQYSKDFLDGKTDGDDYMSLLIHALERGNVPVIELAWRLYADNTSMGEYVTFVANRRKL